jgi:hypothetical protein
MQSIWSESWKSSEFITTKIAFTSRSVAALQENDLANRYPPMPSLTTTLGGTIAAVCFRCQSQRNYEFAMDTYITLLQLSVEPTLNMHRNQIRRGATPCDFPEKENAVGPRRQA